MGQEAGQEQFFLLSMKMPQVRGKVCARVGSCQGKAKNCAAAYKLTVGSFQLNYDMYSAKLFVRVYALSIRDL